MLVSYSDYSPFVGQVHSEETTSILKFQVETEETHNFLSKHTLRSNHNFEPECKVCCVRLLSNRPINNLQSLDDTASTHVTQAALGI